MVNERGESFVDTPQGVQITSCLQIFGDLEKELVGKSWETGGKGSNGDMVLRTSIQVHTP